VLRTRLPWALCLAISVSRAALAARSGNPESSIAESPVSDVEPVAEPDRKLPEAPPPPRLMPHPPSSTIDQATGEGSSPAESGTTTVQNTSSAGALEAGKIGLLPLEFSAFGDFYYQFARPGPDDFHVGSAEVDAALELTPFVTVSNAIAFSGDEDEFALPAFVIDCGLAGEGERYPFQSKLLTKSGVTFGRFNVPFGISYLEYPSVENPFVSPPRAVLATHAAWNDIGVQGYAVGRYFTALGYVVNGPDHPVSPTARAPSRTAAGGRLSGKLDERFEGGGSAAWVVAREGVVTFFAGADLSATWGPLDVRGEYLLRHERVEGLPELTHGAYGRAVLTLGPAFLMGRYDTVLFDDETAERLFAAGFGLELFPRGEVRTVVEQSLDTSLRTVTLQIVGGSSFQPTGLRR
jgi:hypothetical protein